VDDLIEGHLYLASMIPDFKPEGHGAGTSLKRPYRFGISDNATPPDYFMIS
jgi:hypothetical protein